VRVQLSEIQVNEVWKDQRELSAGQVSVLAHLLDVSVEEIAHHAGISTPVPSTPVEADEMKQVLGLLSQMNDRMARLEEEVTGLRQLMQGDRDA